MWKGNNVQILPKDLHSFKRLSELSPIISLLTEAQAPVLPLTLNYPLHPLTCATAKCWPVGKDVKGASAESGHSKCVARCSWDTTCSWLFINIGEKDTVLSDVTASVRYEGGSGCKHTVRFQLTAEPNRTHILCCPSSCLAPFKHTVFSRTSSQALRKRRNSYQKWGESTVVHSWADFVHGK